MPRVNLFGKHRLGSVARGGTWALAQNFSRGAIQIVSTIALSRLIAPEHFGVFAVMLVFHTIITSLIGRAFSTSLIQKADLKEEEASNFLWLGLAIASSFAVLLNMLAPIIAQHFRDPIYEALAFGFGVLICIDTFGAQYQALAMRSLRFDILFKVQLIALPGALGVGVATAQAGWGPWALFAHMATASVLSRFVLALIIGWLPGGFRRDVGVRGMVSFGARMSLGAVSRLLYAKLPILFLSSAAGPASAGYFNRGDGLFKQPFSQLVYPISSLLLPAMSSSADNPQKLSTLLSQAYWLLILTIGPLVAFLAVFGDWVAIILLGSKWLIAGEVVRWMAVMSFGVAFRRSLATVNAAIGRPARAVTLKLVAMPVFVGLLVWASPSGAGITAMVMAIFYLAILPFEVWVLLKGLPFRIGAILVTFGRGAAVMISTLVILWFVRRSVPYLVDVQVPQPTDLVGLTSLFLLSVLINLCLALMIPDVRGLLKLVRRVAKERTDAIREEDR